ncbi:cytochrome ubiquinol oxidase subunit I [Nocardioides massiliensis]|uniref:Cytochrome d ubiquinol oxidase subunit I n=1 Tax=Nocardioides massiliensis TaxID=1325935 RepID=A0ABT9NS46_9ACTN|nr:cytochrome ubiquinol oxidase subunit I [Nocardioides massiliensis]MDP9822650.1 cytochrome d ubiquinol oxidase subunit I [Nocardioides massiliensis]
MEVVDIARWQFGITTVYHFLFVPLTIGLTLIVAIFETLWLRTGRPEYLRLTKFFGKLFIINFALGLVTGIVQEFQFGMNWSDYSRFVGDIFGAPLAIEGLLAFFLESTFIGLWVFGWDKLPRALHAACMWIVHLGVLASSWFILAANSWMQHPVGYEFNAETGRAELTDFAAVMFNKVQLVTFPHVVLAAYMTGAAFVIGISAWLYASKRHGSRVDDDGRDAGAPDREMYRKSMRIAGVLMLVSGIGVAVSGDIQGKIMTEVQPMKMAAAEGLYETAESCAPFSVLTIGTPDGREEKFALTVPCLLSWLGAGSFDAEVKGINELRETYREEYGTDPGAAYYTASEYVPNIPVTYWSFRWMMGFGVIGAGGAALVLWLTRRRNDGARLPSWIGRVGIGLPIALAAANSFGWIFTEMGRQPWVVFGLMTTERGVSPGVSVTEALISVVVLTALYGVLMVIEIGLLAKFTKKGPEPFVEPPDPGSPDHDQDAPMAFAY